MNSVDNIFSALFTTLFLMKLDKVNCITYTNTIFISYTVVPLSVKNSFLF